MTDPKQVYSLRLDAKTLERIDDLIDRYHSIHFQPGFSVGVPAVPKRAEFIRWAVEEGLKAIEDKLAKAEEKRPGRPRVRRAADE